MSHTGADIKVDTTAACVAVRQTRGGKGTDVKGHMCWQQAPFLPFRRLFTALPIYRFLFVSSLYPWGIDSKQRYKSNRAR